MIQRFLQGIFGSKNERELKRLWPRIEKINALEAKFELMGSGELSAQTALFKNRLANGEALDDLLPEAFAVVREASKRVLGMRHFDVQLIGGMVLHEGKISEMKTGEGKTLVATLPAYLNALSGKGVHVVTVNDYLARRDAEWMGQIYGALGLSTGVVVHGLRHDERQQAYASDITYGQNNEFGFDYLRDNMVVELSHMVQRGHNYAIVDEVDSILVDEARTPLIISGPGDDATDKYVIADDIVRKLRENEHYAIELKHRQVTLNDEGVHFVEELLGIDNLYDPRNIELVHHVNQALRAHVIFKRDVDYVVRNGQILIVDEFTGRLMPGRRWSDGQHQAIEAKEKVRIVQESQTIATITFQNYFRMYSKLSGMTGTADTEAVEFKKIYKLEVVIVPTNKPMCRTDHADVVFVSERGKFKAVCTEIAELIERGQPVLVGTASIAKSEVLSEELKAQNIQHNVLNAKQHEREAEIVAQAGRFGAVTISTNMAGRGTDIVLGGNPEFLAAAEAKTKDPADPTYQEQLLHFRELCSVEREKVVAAGGLHIVGTERHESRRIDNQLRGRSGRQGDPGSSRFYVSLEDDLMRRFGGEQMQRIMSRAGLTEEDAIEGMLVSRSIERAQKKVEAFNFDIRKHLLEYDDVMNKQREIIYSLRSRILNAEGVEQEILAMIPDVVEDCILTRASEKEAVERWDLAGMFAQFSRIFGVEISGENYLARQETADKKIAQELFDHLQELALSRYESRKAEVGEEIMSRIQRTILLESIDHFWRDHLAIMDHLREGMGLRGYAQKNPLHEYQREAYEVFTGMMLNVKTDVVSKISTFKILSEEEVRQREAQLREEQARLEAEAKAVHEEFTPEPATRPAQGQEVDNAQNREQRRRQEALTRSRSPLTQADYAPNPLQHQQIGSRSKKDAARKKAKAARQARKRGR